MILSKIYLKENLELFYSIVLFITLKFEKNKIYTLYGNNMVINRLIRISKTSPLVSR